MKPELPPSNDPTPGGLHAPFTLQSWKCSDCSVSWTSGSRPPGVCCCGGGCCEAEDEPAVRPSSTFLMLNFLMVSARLARGPAAAARGVPERKERARAGGGRLPRPARR